MNDISELASIDDFEADLCCSLDSLILKQSKQSKSIMFVRKKTPTHLHTLPILTIYLSILSHNDGNIIHNKALTYLLNCQVGFNLKLYNSSEKLKIEARNLSSMLIAIFMFLFGLCIFDES